MAMALGGLGSRFLLGLCTLGSKCYNFKRQEGYKDTK